jgi:UDP-3-O-[3-hydroxymyristoyl] glucosamine N-acyltransferase
MIRYHDPLSELITSMIIANNKPIRIIGYSQSSMTQEFVNEITKTHQCEVIAPDDFLLDINDQYQYIVAISVDFTERKQIVRILDEEHLDLITVIHDTTLVGAKPPATIAPGSFIFPFCDVALGSTIGRHCIIGPYNLIGHYSQVGNNCITRPNVIISDKSVVGNNCVFNIRSTVINKAHIVDDVEIMGLTNVIKNIDEPGRYIGSTAKKVSV